MQTLTDFHVISPILDPYKESTFRVTFKLTNGVYKETLDTFS